MSDITPATAKTCESHVRKQQECIFELGCEVLGRVPNQFRFASKDASPWREEAGMLAFLLDRDTKADVLTISKLLGCFSSEVRGLISLTSDAIVIADPKTVELLYEIGEKVQDAMDEDEIVWHRKLQPADADDPAFKALSANAQEILRAVISQCGYSLAELRRKGGKHEKSTARSIACALLHSVEQMAFEAIGQLFDRTGNDVVKGRNRLLSRLRMGPYSDHALTLNLICTRLSVDQAILHEPSPRRRRKPHS
ncbi:hypothetical protein K8R03_03950 [Candidatus Kaiserbacteria bacterium]|nr:hypothetical protein [Candidatus Kaiserbacteria bacterium]